VRPARTAEAETEDGERAGASDLAGVEADRRAGRSAGVVPPTGPDIRPGRVGVDADPANRATGIVNRLLPGDGARTQGTVAGVNDWCWLWHSRVGCPDVWGRAWLIAKRMLLTSSSPR